MKKTALISLFVFLLIFAAVELIEEEGLLSLTGTTVVEKIPEEYGEKPEVFFCPEDNCTERFIETFSDAEEIDCAFYDIDVEEIVEFLNEKDARVVLDEGNKNDVSEQLKNKVYDTSYGAPD